MSNLQKRKSEEEFSSGNIPFQNDSFRHEDSLYMNALNSQMEPLFSPGDSINRGNKNLGGPGEEESGNIVNFRIDTGFSTGSNMGGGNLNDLSGIQSQNDPSDPFPTSLQKNTGFIKRPQFKSEKSNIMFGLLSGEQSQFNSELSEQDLKEFDRIQSGLSKENTGSIGYPEGQDTRKGKERPGEKKKYHKMEGSAFKTRGSTQNQRDSGQRGGGASGDYEPKSENFNRLFPLDQSFIQNSFQNQVSGFEPGSFGKQVTHPKIEGLSSDPSIKSEQSSKETKLRGVSACNCKKSKCMKLYCECFRFKQYCTDSCSCTGCFNNEKNKAIRDYVMAELEEKNPDAFPDKFVKKTAVLPGPLHDSKEIYQHSRGCNCKKSNCKKKYCECYQVGVKCTELCRCVACENTDKSKDKLMLRPTRSKTENLAQNNQSQNGSQGSMLVKRQKKKKNLNFVDSSLMKRFMFMQQIQEEEKRLEEKRKEQGLKDQ